MIFKAFEINKINLSKYNLYLFYGENEGYKNEIIKNKFEILYANQIYKYDEKEILENKNEFFNSILTKSFFEILPEASCVSKVLYVSTINLTFSIGIIFCSLITFKFL